MKLHSVLLVLAFGLCGLAADRKADQATAGGPPNGVPAAAVRVDATTWRYTDPKGKAWIYRRTPFGMMKIEENQATPTKSAPRPITKVVEDGDQLHFERVTPFGMQRWTRKKSDLTAEERQIWEEASTPKEAAKPSTEERKK
jgi:hypothetical protein